VASLEDYAAFVAVVERGSLTAAAKQLGRSLQAVSRALASLEQELDVELVQRTTRRSRATAAGEAFFGRVRAVLADLSLARTEVREMHGQLAGKLVIGGPVYFGPACQSALKVGSSAASVQVVAIAGARGHIA